MLKNKGVERQEARDEDAETYGAGFEEDNKRIKELEEKVNQLERKRKQCEEALRKRKQWGGRGSRIRGPGPC